MMILVADQRANDAVNGGVFIALILLTLPFPATDLYFAFNAPSGHVTLPLLREWLVVDAVAQLVLATSYVVATLSSSLLLLRQAVSQLWHIFTFTWTTVGCVLFWHASAAPGGGNDALRVYMWWRLVLGLCSIFAGWWLSRAEGGSSG